MPRKVKTESRLEREMTFIRELQSACVPFWAGWLSAESCDLVPAELLQKLTQRYRELQKMEQ